MSETVTIPKDVAQRLFDALTNSMDFGSGFLETEDVEALRALAVAIGVDPEAGTPAEFIVQYPHRFRDPADKKPLGAAGARSSIAVLVGAAKRQDGHWSGNWGDPGTHWIDTTVIDESKMPDFTPCRAGSFGRWCLKPESDPIHGGAS